MGAQLWHHEAPWRPVPKEALKALQARYLAENYDLAALLPQHLTWAREFVAAAEAEGNPYGLLEIYQAQVDLLVRFCGQPVPEDPEEQIEILRQIYADSGQGIGNVLDVTSVCEQRDVHVAQRLSEPEIERLVGTTRPNRAQAQKAIHKINEELGRGESVCFPICDAGNPVGWCFVGNTID